MINLLLVDNSIILLEGMRSILGDLEHIRIVGEAHDGIEALSLLKTKKIDVVLMDINMPNKDGIDTTKEALILYPYLKILALTMYGEGTFIQKMLSEGACGYLLKNSGRAEIIKAIESVYNIGVYHNPAFSNRMAKRLIQEQEKSKADFVPRLSRKEKAILRLVIEHYSSAEIARKLLMNLAIVETYRNNIRAKIGAKNTSNLVKIVLEKGLV